MPKAEETMSNVASPKESSAKCSKRGKCKIQPIRSSKRLKYDRLNRKSEPGTPPPFVDSNEGSNVLRVKGSYLSSVFRTDSVKKEVETHEQADMDDNLMVTVHETEKDSVKGKKNVSKSVISQSMKSNRVSKSQIDGRVFLDGNKLTESAETVNMVSKTNSHSPSAEDDAKQGLVHKETEQSPKANVLSHSPIAEDAAKQGFVNKKTEQSPIANVLLEYLENKFASAEQTLDIQIPVLDVPEPSCKKSKLGSKVKLSSKRDGRNVLPLSPKGILCEGTAGIECANMNSAVKHANRVEEIICTRSLDPKSGLPVNEIIGPGTDKKGQCEVNSSVDADKLRSHLKEDPLSGSADNMPCHVAENHISNKSLKRGRYRNKLKLSDSPCKQSKEFVSNRTTIMDGMMKKCNDIDDIATYCGNLYLAPCDSQHDMASKHCSEIESNSPDRIGDKEKGFLHTQRSSTENNGQISTNKRHSRRKPLPIPPQRVKTTPEEVSKAFGLKTSRSGRLIVPPLAHWRNQTVAYDLDGGIIAILDGSSQSEENESAFNFKPPQQKNAVKIQRKLCNAANQIIRTPSSVKKTHKD